MTPTVVVLVSTGAAWEARALEVLQHDRRTVVLKRCVDVDDLLATAGRGQAEVAVLGVDLAGLDRTVLDDLARSGMRVVAVATEVERAQPRAARLGIASVLDAARVEEVAQRVTNLPSEDTVPVRPAAPATLAAGPGRVLAVWGPAGAPGRTTLATGLAAELAHRGLDTLLLDADPHGGSVAQQLGILDEASGLLTAARLVAGGTLAERFPAAQRQLAPRLRVLTGLPRPDRWPEVRAGTLTALVEHARHEGQVVLDTGFSVEPDPAADLGRPSRSDLTREALEVADEVLLVGGADPVGLARLARALTELRELRPDPPVTLVVNRMRPSLGWREADVAALLAGFGPSRGVHFLPDDQAAVDRALVAGRLLLETGDGALTRAIGRLLDALARR